MSSPVSSSRRVRRGVVRASQAEIAELRSARNRLAVAALVPALLLVAGTIGFRCLEGWSWFDALYMAVITLTTVGFGEVHPLDAAGRGFTIALALGGIFTVFYAGTEVVRAAVAGELQTLWGRRRMQHRLEELDQHIIVCGFGRMGRLVADEFAAAEVPFVVIDRDRATWQAHELRGGVAFEGDATNDDVLRAAGIARARALVTVLGGDADNLLVTMTARLLAEWLPIVARADEDATERKLRRAGATRVIAPYHLGSARVAQAVLRPAVLDFIEVATRTGHLELQIEQLRVGAASPLAGRNVDEARLREELGIVLLAVQRRDGTMTWNPRGDERLGPGDVLVVAGARAELDRAERLASSVGADRA